MEKEENQNNLSSDQNEDTVKETEKDEENLGEENKLSLGISYVLKTRNYSRHLRQLRI